MNRARAFERYWAEVERPGRPAAEALPPTPELAGAVATATALRVYGEAVPAMDLDSAWLGLSARLEVGAVPAGIPVGREAESPRRGKPNGNLIVLRPRGRWTLRVAAAAVAAMIALATVSLRARPGSALYPVRLTVERAALVLSPRDGAVHLRVAEARLGDLLVALRAGPVQAAPGLARSLVVNRAAAGRAGADLTDLDLRIALEVPPAIRGAPSSIATAVRTILGDLLPPEEPPPAQGPQPAPGPGEQAPGERHEGPGRHKGSGDEREDEGREEGGKHEGHDEGEDEGSGEHEGSGDHEGSDSESSDGHEDESGSHEGSESESSGD